MHTKFDMHITYTSAPALEKNSGYYGTLKVVNAVKKFSFTYPHNVLREGLTDSSSHVCTFCGYYGTEWVLWDTHMDLSILA